MNLLFRRICCAVFAASSLATLAIAQTPTAAASDGAGLITTNQFFAGNVRQQVFSSFTQNDPRKITFSTTVSFRATRHFPAQHSLPPEL